MQQNVTVYYSICSNTNIENTLDTCQTIPIPCNFVRIASDKTIPSCYGIDYNYSIAKYIDLVAQFAFHRLV